MRYIIIYIFVLSGIFSSCEKVVDIPLDNAAKKYVVEATITDQQGGCQVLLSQTKNFTDDNNFEGVSSAVVTITDQDNNITTLPETGTGIYSSATLTGAPGKTYTLDINTNGAAFRAESVMPAKINMDSLYVTEDNFFGETRKTPNVEYKDPTGRGNNYRFILYVNNVKEKSVYVRNDDYSDGNTSTIKLRISEDEDDKQIKTGDSITAEMLCISPSIYKYWYSFNAGATGDNNSASPANPVSNISGGALGYFSAHSVQTKTVVVP